MQCPKCGGQNPDDAYFCGTCGVQLRSSFAASGPVELGSHVAEAALPDELAGPAPDSDAGMPAAGANPFTDAEPTARRAFEESFNDQPSPVPGPPPPPGYAPPGSAYGPPPGAGYAPPPGTGYVPPNAYGPPPGYQTGGNTSGMGDGYPVPPEASGWTFAGFVPWGMFSFVNGNTTMGVIGLVLQFLGFGIVYAIMIGINGKESAWRNRRFDSVQQYVDTMRAWNSWGMWLLIAGVVAIMLYFVLVFAVIGAGIASGDFK